MRTLAIDIGGTAIKFGVLGPQGLGATGSVPTPRPATPAALLQVLADTARDPVDRIGCGFPGVVVDGRTRTAPNLHPAWADFPLAQALTERLGAPARVANDADLHGLAVVEGIGVELVLTLGTGLGSALFVDGRLVPNLELGHHPFLGGRTYEQRLGTAARQADPLGWRAELDAALVALRDLFTLRALYLGGGHAQGLTGLPPDVRVVPPTAGLRGALALWS